MSDQAPLHILHLFPGAIPGGLTRYVLELSRRMTEQGHAITVAGESGAWRNRFDDARIRWLDAPLTRGGPIALWRSARRLEGCVLNERFTLPVDVIHTHTRRSALVGRRLAKRLGVPLLHTLHLTDISSHGIARWLSEFGDVTHAPAEEARQWLIDEARVPADRIAMIPHGIDAHRFPITTPQQQLDARRMFSLPAQATIAGYVGRFDTPKNEEWLLDLAQATRDAMPHPLSNLHLVLAGGGPHEVMLRRRVKEQALEGRVTLLPFGNPLPVYQALDALLLPSLREGFSYVCAEAMATGRPVLRTRTAGTHALIEESVTGRSIPIDHEAFLAAASEFLADRAALQRMGIAAAEHARSHFTLDEQVERTVALYRKMMTKSQR